MLSAVLDGCCSCSLLCSTEKKGAAMGEKMILVEEAQAIMLAHARRTEAVSVPVWQAAGRVLARRRNHRYRPFGPFCQ